ncbi:MANSC domain-containing protein 1 [Hyla sarda]|uniref:MANSC domain-containing protein 1 n=1 Tax=Hyla sarda TaxID=327740 RepID=UPI0024C446D2|nr:MANSC domain-containing protein 1 [Hyla sarda]XP_056373900.1 MANSC domain-containing protein 1 [Hyla sarda]XP_056373901.1 MANSC domain-containing protein 1 [Hyla sarda]
MDDSTPGVPRVLLLVALLLLSVSGSQKCVPRPVLDMVIDINQAVARGARFTDPLRVSSEEECLTACCTQRDQGGDRDCNLLVFDARKDPGLQNCYIFHCPTETSCPLSPSPGVLTYSFFTETLQRPKPSNHSIKKPSAAIGSQGSAKHYTEKDQTDASKSITSRLLHLTDKIDQRLEKMESEGDLHVRYPSPTTILVPAIQTTTTPVHREGKKVPPDAKVAKPVRVTNKKPDPLKIYFPTEAAKTMGTLPIRTSPRIGTSSAPQPVPPAASQDVSGAKKVASSSKSAKLPGSGHVAVVSPKVNRPLTHTEGPELKSVHQTRAPQIVTHPAPLWTSPWKGVDKASTGGDEGDTAETHPPLQEEPAVNLKEAPRNTESGAVTLGGVFPSLEDKSGLVAALVFGLLFLIVVIGLVSRKVSEARRRHRYTKLDYLINGMYVDT